MFKIIKNYAKLNVFKNARWWCIKNWLGKILFLKFVFYIESFIFYLEINFLSVDIIFLVSDEFLSIFILRYFIYSLPFLISWLKYVFSFFVKLFVSYIFTIPSAVLPSFSVIFIDFWNYIFFEYFIRSYSFLGLRMNFEFRQLRFVIDRILFNINIKVL